MVPLGNSLYFCRRGGTGRPISCADGVWHRKLISVWFHITEKHFVAIPESTIMLRLKLKGCNFSNCRIFWKLTELQTTDTLYNILQSWNTIFWMFFIHHSIHRQRIHVLHVLLRWTHHELCCLAVSEAHKFAWYLQRYTSVACCELEGYAYIELGASSWWLSNRRGKIIICVEHELHRMTKRNKLWFFRNTFSSFVNWFKCHKWN